VPWTARPKEKATIAVDMDGVLVEQVVPVLRKLKQETDVELNKYDITDWEYPFKGANIRDEIEKAEREEQFVREMPLIKDATEALKVLSKKFDIVVAASREPLTDRWSHGWLDAHGIPYTRLINTRSEGKALSGVDLLIDDYIGNIEEFVRKGPPGSQAILFVQPWNHDTRGITDLIASGKVRIAHSWQAVLALLGCGLSEAEPVKKVQTPKRESEAEMTGEYFSLQSLSCFFSGFLFLRGKALSDIGASLFLQPMDWLYIPLAGVFLVLSFFFIVAAFPLQLPQRVAKYILKVAGPPIMIPTLAGIIVAWVDGIGGLAAHGLWFQVFFWTGFAFVLVCDGYFIFSCWRHGRMSKTKN
jgi:5'(3')-deoxyribonucleotidase